MERVFINLTNHPSRKWDKRQREEAEKIGSIIDFPFPEVSPDYSSEEVITMAEKIGSKIISYHPSGVLCQGEFTLCYHVVNLLKENGVNVFAACSKREVIETEDGKVVRFNFERFRKY